MIIRFVVNKEKWRKYMFYGGSPCLLHITWGVRGVIKTYYNIIWGGPVLPIYYNITWGGGLSGPQICMT